MEINKTICLIIIILLTVGLQAQMCDANVIHTSPTSRFTINDNGTATDNTTGLIWMRCSLGQNWNGSTCIGTAGTYNWQDALDNAEGFSYADASDWRLPNIKELRSIVEGACTSPAANESVFPNIPLFVAYYFSYWSSTSTAENSERAWTILFEKGRTGSSIKTDTPFPVRFVRAGQ